MFTLLIGVSQTPSKMHYKITSLSILTEVLNSYESQHFTLALSHVYLVNCIPINQILALILYSLLLYFIPVRSLQT